MRQVLFVLAFVCILFATATADRSGVPSKLPGLKSQANVNPAGLHVDFGSIPLYFTANRGQVDGRARFYAKAARYTLWLTEGGLVFDSFKSENPKVDAGKEISLRHDKIGDRKFKRDVSRLVFLNASKKPEIVALDETPLKVNYFIGNDPKKWHTAVPTSKAILYKNIYKNIDLKVYGVESRIEYDWIVRPGGNPRDIKFKYTNVKGTRINKGGDLLVKMGFGGLVHKKPAAYQEARGESRAEGQSGIGTHMAVESGFKKVGKNAYGFEVGAYEAGLELVIDPVVLAYSSYLGGSGDDYGFGIAVDASGDAYVIGLTNSSNFPTRNQYQPDQGITDVFVTKIDTTQSGNASLVYSTYLGGSGNDGGYGIAADNSGIAYVTGDTYSADFPILNQYQTYRGGGAGEDVFVTKLDTMQSGNASLVYSTYLGGTNGGDGGKGIAVDNSGNAYVTGYTYCSNFPTLNQCQPYQSGQDAFLTKLDTTKSGNASLIYSTYLGGNSSEYGTGIAVDSSGNAYVIGLTNSSNFPTLNQYQADQAGRDAFLTKVDTTKSGVNSLVYSTYLGGSSNEEGYGIAVDNSGNAYVTGYTYSTNFPTLNQYQTFQASYDAFVTKLDTTKSGNAGLIYSTCLGGNGGELGWGIAIDSSGNAYVSGYTGSTNFPNLNQYQTDQPGYDVFLAKLDTTKSGTAGLVYSTYLGGNGDDWDYGIAVDAGGNAYVTGNTASTNFPTLNQYQTDQAGIDGFIAKIRASADIAINKTSDNLTPKVGENFIFTITATNNGPLGATGLRVLDALPAGLAYVSSTASTGTYTLATGIWDIGALANGATTTLTLTVQGTAGGDVTNTASVSALNEYDPASANDSASVTVNIKCVLTIMAGTGGTTNPVPGTYTYDEGTSVSIQATASAGYRFWNWSGDATGTTNPTSVTMNGNKTVTANFIRQYTLTIVAGEGGSTSPVPGTYTYDQGTSVSILATAATGYRFVSWSGDASDSVNPVTLIMNGNKAVRANFARVVQAPLNLTGEKLVNRNVSMAEYVIKLKWQPNGANAGTISYRIYRIENGQATAIANGGAGTYEYIVHGLQATKAYRFGVTAVNSLGWESDMVQVAVQ